MSRWTFSFLPEDERENDVVAFVLNDLSCEFEGDQHVAHLQPQAFQDDFGEVMESTFEPLIPSWTEHQVRNRLVDLGYIEDSDELYDIDAAESDDD